jgi:hypothetical protein
MPAKATPIASDTAGANRPRQPASGQRQRADHDDRQMDREPEEPRARRARTPRPAGERGAHGRRKTLGSASPSQGGNRARRGWSRSHQDAATVASPTAVTYRVTSHSTASEAASAGGRHQEAEPHELPERHPDPRAGAGSPATGARPASRSAGGAGRGRPPTSAASTSGWPPPARSIARVSRSAIGWLLRTAEPTAATPGPPSAAAPATTGTTPPGPRPRRPGPAHRRRPPRRRGTARSPSRRRGRRPPARSQRDLPRPHRRSPRAPPPPTAARRGTTRSGRPRAPRPAPRPPATRRAVAAARAARRRAPGPDRRGPSRNDHASTR